MNQPFQKRRERLNLFQQLFKRSKPPQNLTLDNAVTACPVCQSSHRELDIHANFLCCPSCQHLYPVAAFQRISMVCDDQSFTEYYGGMESFKLARFPNYAAKLTLAQKNSGLKEAVITGTATLRGERIAIAVMDAKFMMGSMGQVVGEKLTRLIELATRRKLPLIIFSASGGARMQEGIMSLMQMAKTSAALSRFEASGGFYCSVLTHPTTGGVSASFAMLGDVILAEPHALIGFAGRRVIEKTMNQQLPDDFQKAEFLLEHGFVDRIVKRHDMPTLLYDLIRLHAGEKR